MVLFLLAILSFTWRTGSVSDPSDRPPLGDRAALGLRITITCVLLLGLGYMAMIIMTLKAYGSPSSSTRTGMGTRNTMQGSGTPIDGNTTQDHGAGTSEKIRVRDVDAAMERRGRPRERSTSTHVRRREEDVERRQHRGQSGIGDNGKKDRRNLKGMHGLGSGSRVLARDGSEFKELVEAEMDLMIDGLP
jgi:hypothetical protein